MALKQKKSEAIATKPAKATKPSPVAAKRKAAPPRTRPRTTSKALSENEVRQKAYFLWESRGCPIGSPEVDWYTAKEQLSPGSPS
jgi:hypothetical protein